MIPLLRHIGVSIACSWKKITGLRSELDTAKGMAVSGLFVDDDGNPEDKIGAIKGELNEEIEQINGFIKEIEALGGYVQNFRPLRCDFPSVLNKRQVFLCLRPLTDDEVSRYHEVDETCSDATQIPHK